MATLTVTLKANTEAFEAAMARVEAALLEFEAARKALNEIPIEVTIGKVIAAESLATLGGEMLDQHR